MGVTKMPAFLKMFVKILFMGGLFCGFIVGHPEKKKKVCFVCGFHIAILNW